MPAHDSAVDCHTGNPRWAPWASAARPGTEPPQRVAPEGGPSLNSAALYAHNKSVFGFSVAGLENAWLYSLDVFVMDSSGLFNAALGGFLIGLAACVLMLFNGRIAGITGVVKRVWPPVSGDVMWRVAFVLGLLSAAGVYFAHSGQGGLSRVPVAPALLVVAGVLTGWARLWATAAPAAMVCVAWPVFQSARWWRRLAFCWQAWRPRRWCATVWGGLYEGGMGLARCTRFGGVCSGWFVQPGFGFGRNDQPREGVEFFGRRWRLGPQFDGGVGRGSADDRCGLPHDFEAPWPLAGATFCAAQAHRCRLTTGAGRCVFWGGLGLGWLLPGPRLGRLEHGQPRGAVVCPGVVGGLVLTALG